MSLVVDGVVARGAFSRVVSISIEPGRPVGLVGPNGSGKSTTLRAIAGLDRLASGTISLDGSVLDGADAFVPAELRGVGVVFQTMRLFPHLTALDNVAFGLRCAGASRHDARGQARRLLTSVGADHVADRRPATLSGGEAQRVALARALAPSPRVLLLDEPFASVDADSRPALRALLRSLVVGSGICSVIVSHDRADISDLTDVVVDLGSAG